MNNKIDIQLNNRYFSVAAQIRDDKVEMNFKVNSNFVSTSSFPRTHDILEKEYPEVLRTNCFNEFGLPFDKEVVNTELAHLFEHILIQKLAYKRYQKSKVDKQYTGETEWCCDNEPVKEYNITLNANVADIDVFPEALAESSSLVSSIMSSK